MTSTADDGTREISTNAEEGEAEMSDLMNTPAATTQADELRTRIRIVAAGIFAQRGFTDASVEEVCSETGIDSRTFASHYPDKYDLFREVVNATSLAMLRATDGLESNDPRQARAVLSRIIEQCARVAIATRATGGFYRSEYRYLTRDDAKTLSDHLAELRRRIREPLMLHRASLNEKDATVLASAALSTIASITVHATSLPAPKLQTLLTVTAMRILDSEPAEGEMQVGMPATPVGWQGDTSEKAPLIAAAVELCFERGYRGATMKEVAHQAGMSLTEANRHFGSLSDLLAHACHDGYRSLEYDLRRALETSFTPRDTLISLCQAYVRHYIADYKLMTVYLADARNFDDENRAAMLQLQENSVCTWTRALRDARPELSDVEARFLVFAALNLISDLSRLLRWSSAITDTNKIEKCASIVMALIR